jgi:hypothetical protein
MHSLRYEIKVWLGLYFTLPLLGLQDFKNAALLTK